MRWKRWAVVALLAGLAAGPAQAELKIVEESAVPADTHQFELHSAILDRDLIVRVAPPPRPPTDGSKVAVFYTLDATTSFDLVSSIAKTLQRSGKMAPAYVVAIGYPADAGILRTYDYLHVTEGPYPNGGGGAAFEKAVMQEIRPFIEAKLPIDPARAVLGGHSFGGLFAAHVAVEHPDEFAGYLVSSASFWVGDEDTNRLAQALVKRGGAKSKRLFVSVGGSEETSMTDTSARFFTTVTAPKSGFTAARQVWPGETHGSVYPWALLKGLPFVLPPDPSQQARNGD